MMTVLAVAMALVAGVAVGVAVSIGRRARAELRLEEVTEQHDAGVRRAVARDRAQEDVNEQEIDELEDELAAASGPGDARRRLNRLLQEPGQREASAAAGAVPASTTADSAGD